jgi:hypothetical protein
MANKVRRHVSLDPHEDSIVTQVQKDTGLDYSPTLGVLLREWARLRQLLDVARAYRSGVITEKEAIERLAVLADQISLA